MAKVGPSGPLNSIFWTRRGETMAGKVRPTKDGGTRAPTPPRAGGRPAPPGGLRYKYEVLPALHEATFISQPELFEMVDPAGRVYYPETVIRDTHQALRGEAIEKIIERRKRRAAVYKGRYP